LLANQIPAAQAQLKPRQRTAKEHVHRLAAAITAYCRQHQALCVVENVAYRSASPGPYRLKSQQSNARTVFQLLTYKLPLAELAAPLDMRGVAPKRDCGTCGQRHAEAAVQAGFFQCAHCGAREEQAKNTVREVARRGLWFLSKKKPPKPKKVTTQ
jgi:hypothetical protein